MARSTLPGEEAGLSRDVFIDWVQRVTPPAQSSTYYLLLLIKILSCRSCRGVDFLQLIDEYVLSDKKQHSGGQGAAPEGAWLPRPGAPSALPSNAGHFFTDKHRIFTVKRRIRAWFETTRGVGCGGARDCGGGVHAPRGGCFRLR